MDVASGKMRAGSDAGCVFCDVLAGERAADLVWADDSVVAFLDHRPLFHGHSLVVPRRHAETIDDLASGELEPLFSRVRLLSVAVRDAMGAEGSFIAVNNVVSQSVPHLHVHVVPRVRGDGLRGFFWPRTTYPVGEAARVAAAIGGVMNGLVEGTTGAGR